MTKTTDIETELSAICRKNGGVLQAKDVVEYARNEETALHSRFTWDDAKAAVEHRLWQAREIIHISVILPAEGMEPMRVYINLMSDRTQEGGGYRLLVDVLSDEEKTEELLAQALAEFKRWRAKYQALKALVPVFRAAEKVAKRRPKRRKKR